MAWFEAQPDLDPERLVFIDETGASTKMAGLRGRAPRGERCRAPVPHGYWLTTTVIGALRLSGLTAPMLLDGPKAAAFKASVEQAAPDRGRSAPRTRLRVVSGRPDAPARPPVRSVARGGAPPEEAPRRAVTRGQALFGSARNSSIAMSLRNSITSRIVAAGPSTACVVRSPAGRTARSHARPSACERLTLAALTLTAPPPDGGSAPPRRPPPPHDQGHRQRVRHERRPPSRPTARIHVSRRPKPQSSSQTRRYSNVMPRSR